ncbi:4Fe-4S ferredoxin [Soehngenia longivitae]|uniref:4Fe-4S ferredoxin n=1 Tax=Soehngenia longivitae TaxID=2562294 RepID=A0A4Z0D5M0_9FIRM|nr:4Fe-4S binding protein [Soehngenia longivitae]TFZ39943.1 4Fe-4S ferredoxin [Soehngenia longivitae]
MKRRIISIDEEKCNGCGLCANACHEGAIGMIDGKAKLLRDDYCDGLGDCLPVCPTGAITFVEREALEYDEKAVLAKKSSNDNHTHSCPGSMAKAIKRDENISSVTTEKVNVSSMLKQWPVQIKLAPIKAPYFQNANLLIAADCTAYAYGNFHNEFMKNKITLIGCPKLDMVDYSEKLTEIIRQNDIMSVTIVRMEVPCCGGIVEAVKRALMGSGKFIPWQVVTISADGRILD